MQIFLFLRSMTRRAALVAVVVLLAATACSSDGAVATADDRDPLGDLIEEGDATSTESGATDEDPGDGDAVDASEPTEALTEDDAMSDDDAMDDAIDVGESMEAEESSGSSTEELAMTDAAGSAEGASSASDAAARAVDDGPDAAAEDAVDDAPDAVDAEDPLVDDEAIEPVPTVPPVRPQAGLLTAGDIDDNLNLDYFAQIVGSWQQEEGRGVPYVELRDRLTIDLVGDNGVGIGNVALTIATDTDARIVHTNSAGRAFVYPSWLGLDVSDRFLVASDLGEWMLTVDEFVDGATEIVADGPTTPPSQLDIALVLDVTGSMADELAYLTTEFESIVARLEADYGNVDMAFSLIVYRDVGDEFVTRVFDFTGDVRRMQGWLADQQANGGGDFPEAMDAALIDVTELSWRTGADTARVLVLNADAPPHNADVQAALDAALALGEQGVRIYPLAASGVDRSAEFIMRAMAVTTGGRHLFLTGDSGIGGAKLEPKAQCYLVTGLDDLLYRVIASELAGERIEPADAQIVRTVGQYDRGVCA